LSSSNKTSHLALNQWQRTDPVVMDDFNADNAKLDAAIGGMKMPVVKLLEVVTSAAAAAVELDLSGIDLTQYRALEVCSQAVSNIVKDNAYAFDYLYLRINNDSGSSAYYNNGSSSAISSIQLPNFVDTAYPPAALGIFKMSWTNFTGSNNLLMSYIEGGYFPSTASGTPSINAISYGGYLNFHNISALRTINFVSKDRGTSASSSIAAGAKFTIYGYLA
jgi:hypothetical protein